VLVLNFNFPVALFCSDDCWAPELVFGRLSLRRNTGKLVVIGRVSLLRSCIGNLPFTRFIFVCLVEQPPSRCLYVWKLAESVLEGDLSNVFQQYGNISSVRVTREMKTGISRGFGFVYMETIEDAITVSSLLNVLSYLALNLNN